jgi:serine/threonine protein kinase
LLIKCLKIGNFHCRARKGEGPGEYRLFKRHSIKKKNNEKKTKLMKNTSTKSIGKYQIRSRLGQGAMGQVYKVIVPGENRFAALKVLKPNSELINKMGVKWIYEQFINEFAVISNSHHPNVVKVWNLEEKDDHVYYLMEYFSRNLGIIMGESYWADKPSRVLRIGKAVDYILGTLEGLSILHQKDIIHQDIKPFNLMLTDKDMVKITDFGLSKRRGEILTSPTKMMIGTPYYAAPEQINSPENADNRSDLYSVGVMFYRMLTGILPQKQFELPGTLNPELDAGWDELIVKSIHHNPARRFQDAKSMINEIQTHYQDFKNQKQMACNVPGNFLARRVKKGSSDSVMLRSKSERVLGKRAKSVFKIDEFHRPQQYLENNFGFVKDGVLVDGITNLAWQQSGSKSPLQWEQAKHYIINLNQQRFGGYGDWRLPTINELLSLLNPPPPGEDFCFQSQMSSVQKWIWSGDTRSKRTVWFVDCEMGFVASSDILDCYYAKAVCYI